VRLFVLHNFTGVQNSLGHMFGSAPFLTRDRSTNIFWLALPTFGDAYHNHHHAFPYSAIVALRWWQIDPSGWFIRLLALSGLAWNVKVPTARMIREAPKRS
jgi:stearoyl-CoA desaturase (delta-9 desaturase)